MRLGRGRFYGRPTAVSSQWKKTIHSYADLGK